MVTTKKIRNAVANAVRQSWFESLPIQQIDDALRALDLKLVCEDGSDFDAIFCGREGRSLIDVADIDDPQHPVGQVLVTWYKSDCHGATPYDVVAYYTR